MKIAIIYKSFLGATKQYSQWLAEELKADLFKFSEIKKDKLASYDLIIVGSGTYASGMPLTGYLKKYWEILKNKKVIAMAVGMAPAEAEWSQKSYQQIPEKIRSQIKYFKLMGKGGQPKPGEQIKKENLKGILDHIKTMS